jgi:phenylacetate-CoA ligase
MLHIPEILRRRVFWLVDGLKGGTIKNHLEDIENVIEHGNSTSSIKRKHELLWALLRHAASTTAYYSGRTKFTSHEDFPVVNKGIIREASERFCSGKFGASERINVFTSGSTGTPFQVYQNKEKKERNSADTIYFARRAGFDIGHKLFYMKIWVKEKMDQPLHYFIQNIVPVDVIKLNNSQIEKLLTTLQKDSSRLGILGYASALELVARYLDERPDPGSLRNVKSIIAISESLNDYTKSMLQKHFGVPVLSRYSNLENGIIAQQESNGLPRYLVNTASYIVEILKLDSDDPTKDGQSGRIVVTDLFNYAMPMIRYDTGDVGALMTDPNEPGKQFLSKVEGRKLDLLYDTKNNLISSFIVYKNMWKYPEIIQYQLIQEGEKDYTFKINIRETFTHEVQLVDEFKLYLGSDARLKVEYVSEVPLLTSGKRKKIVNNYIKT